MKSFKILTLSFFSFIVTPTTLWAQNLCEPDEVNSFLEYNDFFSALDKEQQKKFCFLVTKLPSNEAPKEQEIANAFRKEVLAVLEKHDYKNVGTGQSFERCPILKDLVLLYEKRESYLNKQFAKYVEKDQYSIENKYFRLINNQAYLNRFEFKLNENSVDINGISTEFTHIEANELGGECGEFNFDFITFSNENSKGALLNNLINREEAKEVVELKQHPAIIRKFVANSFGQDLYTYTLSETIDYLDDEILSFSKTQYIFRGGAHGQTFIQKYSFDLDTQQNITLEDIFTKEDIPALLRIARQAFKKARKVDSTKSWKENGYWFEVDPEGRTKWQGDDGFYLTSNFNFDNRGITFVYQQYDVTGYAGGLPKFTLSWQEVAPFVRKDSKVKKYLNIS